MSEEWKVQASFKSSAGALLNIRAQELHELAGLVDEARQKDEFREFFPRLLVAGAPVGPNGEMSEEQAQALVTKHLGPGTEEPASAAQVTYLVKLGVSAQDARALSKKAASARISELKEAK